MQFLAKILSEHNQNKRQFRVPGFGPVFATFCLMIGLCIEARGFQDSKDQSKLQLFVAIKAGHLAADRGRSKFTPSQVFTSRLRITQAETEKVLFDDLDRAFAALPGLYFYALSDDEKASDTAGTLNDPATNNIRNFSGTWTAFVTAFDQWANSGVNRFPLAMVFSGVGVLQDVTNFDESTSLIFDDPDARDFDSGQLSFRVADAIGDWNNTQDYQITFPDQASGARLVASRRRIAELLSPLTGKLWRPADIRARIEDFYVARGLQPNINLSRASENPNRVGIREGLRIARIISSQSADQDLDKILYLLLSDRQFRTFLRNRSSIMSDSLDVPGQSGLRAVDFVKHLGSAPGDEPYVNLIRQQIQQQQLALIGYAISPVISNARPQPEGIAYVDLQVQKISDSSAPKNKPEESAPLLANNEGVIDSNLQDVERKTPFVPPATTPKNKSGSQSNDSGSEKKNYLGGGFLYTPGQGVKLIGLYQRSQLFADNDSLSVKGGGQSSGLGGINYFADYVFFGRLHRRLSLQFTGSTDFT